MPRVEGPHRASRRNRRGRRARHAGDRARARERDPLGSRQAGAALPLSAQGITFSLKNSGAGPRPHRALVLVPEADAAAESGRTREISSETLSPARMPDAVLAHLARGISRAPSRRSPSRRGLGVGQPSARAVHGEQSSLACSQYEACAGLRPARKTFTYSRVERLVGFGPNM